MRLSLESPNGYGRDKDQLSSKLRPPTSRIIRGDANWALFVITDRDASILKDNRNVRSQHHEP